MTTTENLELELVSGTETFDTDKVMNNFTKIDTAVGNLQDGVGNVESLTTTVKTDLVAAINEVDGNIGDLSGLSTTAKTNLVAAVNELNQKSVFEQIAVRSITINKDTSINLKVSISNPNKKVPVAVFDASTACGLIIKNAWPGSGEYNVSIGNVDTRNIVNADILITFLVNP